MVLTVCLYPTTTFGYTRTPKDCSTAQPLPYAFTGWALLDLDTKRMLLLMLPLMG